MALDPTLPESTTGSGGGVAGAFRRALALDPNLTRHVGTRIVPGRHPKTANNLPFVTITLPTAMPTLESDRVIVREQDVLVSYWDVGFERCNYWGLYLNAFLLSFHGDAAMTADGFAFDLLPKGPDSGPTIDPTLTVEGGDVFRYDFRYLAVLGQRVNQIGPGGVIYPSPGVAPLAVLATQYGDPLLQQNGSPIFLEP